jgi:hypothetical protein
MEIGDLVQYDDSTWSNWLGIIVRQIPGTEENQVIQWNKQSGIQTTCPKRNLRVINANR